MSTPPTRVQRAGTWFDRNGGKVVKGAAVVGGVAVIGGVAYFAVESLFGGFQPPACTALQNELQGLQTQLLSVYKQASQQGGTFTSSQQAQVQSLQQEINGVISQMASVCVSSPGTTLEQTLNQIIVYGLWAAAIAVGLVVSAATIRWLWKRWGGGGTASAPRVPTSPKDVTVSPEFDPATTGADAANAQTVGDYDAGNISSSEATSRISNISANDPAIGVSGQIADALRAAASTASEVGAALLDALAALWDAIVTALQDLVLEVQLVLGL